MYEKVSQVLRDVIAPKLAEHQGGVALLSVENGIVRIRLLGQCANCPSAYITTEQLILKEIQKVIPEVNQVITEHVVSEELMEQARKILRCHE